MANREPYGTGPQDVDVVRREMVAKLVGEHQREEIEKFFYYKVNPAFFDFFECVKELVKFPLHTLKRSETAWLYGQRSKIDPNDQYNVMLGGIEVTDNEWLFFYYYVYATSSVSYPPWLDLYTVIVKSDGKYRIINNLYECSKDALFDNIKQSFLEAKAQIEH
jgi:hypothetical protein